MYLWLILWCVRVKLRVKFTVLYSLTIFWIVFIFFEEVFSLTEWNRDRVWRSTENYSSMLFEKMTHKSNVGSQRYNLDDVIFYHSNIQYIQSEENNDSLFFFVFESNWFLFDFYFSFDDLNRNLEEPFQTKPKMIAFSRVRSLLESDKKWMVEDDNDMKRVKVDGRSTKVCPGGKKWFQIYSSIGLKDWTM